LGECRLRITEENGPVLTEMPLQRNNTLRELDLSFNEAISDNAASFIAEGLKKNTILKTLNLNFCSITGEGIRLIQSCTSTCKICYAR
jgi:Ran GTPase-activating protein (RanGAP) involved in mRNA processing and transport